MFYNMYDIVLLASMNPYIDLCATIIVITDVIIQNQKNGGKRTTAVYRVILWTVYTGLGKDTEAVR